MALRRFHGALFGLLVVAVAACGGDSREMRPPSSDQTTTSRPPITVEDSGDTSETGEELVFQLTTSAFLAGDAIPDLHTCRGEDSSPTLRWANAPSQSQSLAIVVRDLNAEVDRRDGARTPFVHWIVGGIDPTTEELPEGQISEGAVETLNDFGNASWGGPCPPDGSGDHVYEFRIYALSEPLDLAEDLEPEQAIALIEGVASYDTAAITGIVTG